MMDEKKVIDIILPDDPRAASIMTVTGWVSRTGHFFGSRSDSEHMARYDGSTHRKCEGCGAIIDKSGYCRVCHAEREIEKFNKMEKRPWNGTDTLYSFSSDEYFFSQEDLDDHCDNEGVTPAELRLVICVPTYATPIDPVEHYCDDLPEDRDEVPGEVADAFKELNDRLIEAKVILSWSPGRYAADLGPQEASKIPPLDTIDDSANSEAHTEVKQ
jgi:hypothetical protein